MLCGWMPRDRPQRLELQVRAPSGIGIGDKIAAEQARLGGRTCGATEARQLGVEVINPLSPLV